MANYFIAPLVWVEMRPGIQKTKTFHGFAYVIEMGKGWAWIYPTLNYCNLASSKDVAKLKVFEYHSDGLQEMLEADDAHQNLEDTEGFI